MGWARPLVGGLLVAAGSMWRRGQCRSYGEAEMPLRQPCILRRVPCIEARAQ